MRPPPKAGRRARKKRTIKKNNFQENSRIYDVVSSLANASTDLTFGQLILEDGDEAKKDICRLCTTSPRRPVAAAIGTLPKRLKVVPVPLYGTKMRALLDSGAISDVLNASVASQLYLSPKKTSTKMTVANGQKNTYLGAIIDVPVSFKRHCYFTQLSIS